MSVSARLAAALRNAAALAASGDLHGARNLVAQEIRTASRGLGRDHPEVLAAQRQLASLHVELGELAEAESVLAGGLSTGLFRLGDVHPVMLGITYDLGRIAEATGDVAAARRAFERLARYGPMALGEHHEYVRTARSYLRRVDRPSAGVCGQSGPRYQPSELQPDRPRYETGPVGRSEGQQPDDIDQIDRDNYMPIFDPRRSGSDENDPGSGRIGLVIAAALSGAALLGGGSVAAVLANGSGNPHPSAPAAPSTPALVTPTAPAASVAPSGAPAGLMVLDSGTSVRLSWTVPAGQPARFTIAASKDSPVVPVRETTDPEATVDGLDPGQEYCFTVTAVYDTGWSATSAPACTKRR